MRFWRSLSASELFVGSFLGLVVLGTVGFKVLPGLYTGPELSWLDALFTATSAVCVTGLIVVDTAEFFTTWGQAYVLLLIQLGGLGIISFTSLIIVALGRRLSLRTQSVAGSGAEVSPQVDERALLRAVFVFTFAVEAIGAAALYLCWVPRFGWDGAVWPSIFHAVSAFCNAGFSTFSTSLAGFQTNAPLLLVVMVLIVLGGVGFLTLEELSIWWKHRTEARVPADVRDDPSPTSKRRFRLSTHSQLVLLTTAGLIAAGGVAFTYVEWTHALGDLPVWAKLTNGLFASVTTRTAGFNTIDYGSAHPSTNFLTIILMTIGGSPGSTAGGIKTTTFALLGLVALSRLRGLPTTNAFGRTIPERTVNRAVGLFVLAVGLTTAVVLLYTATELPGPLAAGPPHDGFFPLFFEAVSAFNTVGLSMGVTGDLSVVGRWTTVVAMFIGRVGPLTLAATLSRDQRSGDFRYAYEDVMVG